MRILIAEDEKKIADFIRRGLKEEGYAADIAGTGPDALELVSENPYDLLLLDIMLPGMTINTFAISQLYYFIGFIKPGGLSFSGILYFACYNKEKGRFVRGPFPKC